METLQTFTLYDRRQPIKAIMATDRRIAEEVANEADLTHMLLESGEPYERGHPYKADTYHAHGDNGEIIPVTPLAEDEKSWLRNPESTEYWR